MEDESIGLGFALMMLSETSVRLPCGHVLEFDAPPTEEELRRATGEHIQGCERRQ